MVFSVLPGLAFADTANEGREPYTQLQKAGGMKIYMMNCGTMETEKPDIFADSNEYTSRWDIEVDTNQTAYFDNYILNKPDSSKEIEFVFSVGGSGMNNVDITKDTVIKQIEDYVKVVDADGVAQKMSFELRSAKHSGSGGGSGGGPDRAMDVIVTVAGDTLEANTSYALVIYAGMNLSGKGTLEKNVSFKFETAPILVNAITIDKKTVTLNEGEKATLSATVAPEKATDKTVTWASSNDKVAKVDANGKITAISAGTATITVATNDGSKLEATTNVTVKPVFAKLTAKAVSNSYNSVKVTWTKDKKADGYTVYRYNAKTKKYVAVKNTTACSYTNTKLTTGNTYTYKVKAYRVMDGKKVYGNYSTKVSAKPVPATMNMTVKAKKGGKVAIQWDKVAGTTKYVVYKSTKKNSGYYKERITVQTKYTDTGLKKGKTYYYKARAYKVVDGKKIYGKYTKVFTVKAK